MSPARTGTGRQRRTRETAKPPGPWQGAELEVLVGPPAHGGHCVARPVGEPDGRVLFVRHALPGERVLARVLEDRGGSFVRADAVAVLDPSPDRVAPPCPHAGPGKCGGCDWQHASPAAQRALKAAVVREALARQAGLADVPVEVRELPGGMLGWRTRAQFAVDPSGRPGLRRHRSHSVEALSACPLCVDAVNASGVFGRAWPPGAVLEVTAASSATSVLATLPDGETALAGPSVLTEQAAGRDWTVTSGGFWQVHPAAADALVGAVLRLTAPRPGERVLDLYAGAGLFAGALAAVVAPAGRVLAVEGDARAVHDAEVNLAGLPWASVRHAAVTAALVDGLDPFDVVVLDPPRTGAGPEVLRAVLAHGPRAVAYVACDPVAMARDVRAAVDAGYRLAGLEAYDLFPMTQHVECVALLTR